MSAITRYHSNDRISQIIISDKRIETSGLVAQDGHHDIGAQTRCVLNQLDSLLHTVGTDKNQLTRIQIWLADMADFDAMNHVYDAWLSDSTKPTRACVGAQLASQDYLIEIQATAYLPD